MTTKEKLIERWENNRISEAMLRIYVSKGLITDADFKEITGNESGLDPATQLTKAKQSKIAESKTLLATYLETHPLQWSDGKYYSVTSEKQSLLTSNLALYQISAAAGQPFKLTWNSTGDECVEWTYENLASLALAIGVYVKPFVSHQQELELDINACTTLDELNTVEIIYDIITAPTEATDGNAS